MRSFCQLLPLLALAGSAAATTNATTAPASQKPRLTQVTIGGASWHSNTSRTELRHGAPRMSAQSIPPALSGVGSWQSA